jgi:hypothetical protein
MSDRSDAPTTKTDDQKNQATAADQKPDVSDLGGAELLPKLFEYFHNNPEELARAIAVDTTMVEDWLAGSGEPNEATVLRMRRLAQERGIE